MTAEKKDWEVQRRVSKGNMLNDALITSRTAVPAERGKGDACECSLTAVQSMSLQEYRLFLLYLSRIDPKDPLTRKVLIPYADLCRSLDIGRIRMPVLRDACVSLLGKIVVVQRKNRLDMFQLFSRCAILTDPVTGQHEVELVAHEEAIPLMFRLVGFTSYDYSVVTRLRGLAHIRLYELLKQYESIGVRVIDIEWLRSRLGIAAGQYERLPDLRRWVLQPAVDRINELTDISVTYEPCGARGHQTDIEFRIASKARKKNADVEENARPGEMRREYLTLIRGALPDTFTEGQADELGTLARMALKSGAQGPVSDLDVFEYLLRKTKLLEARTTKVSNPYTWLKKAVKNNWE